MLAFRIFETGHENGSLPVIVDRKPSNNTRHQNPRRSSRSLSREYIQNIRRNGGRCPQSTETEHTPPEGNSRPTQRVLDSLAEKHETGDTEHPRGVDGPKPVLGLVLTVVGANVAVLEEIVEEVAPDFGEEGADHGGEEEEGELC